MAATSRTPPATSCCAAACLSSSPATTDRTPGYTFEDLGEPRAEGAHGSVRGHPLPLAIGYRDDRRAVVAQRDRCARRLPGGGGRRKQLAGLAQGFATRARAARARLLRRRGRRPGRLMLFIKPSADRRRAARRAAVPAAAPRVSAGADRRSVLRRSAVGELSRAGRAHRHASCLRSRAVTDGRPSEPLESSDARGREPRVSETAAAPL